MHKLDVAKQKKAAERRSRVPTHVNGKMILWADDRDVCEAFLRLDGEHGDYLADFEVGPIKAERSISEASAAKCIRMVIAVEAAMRMRESMKHLWKAAKDEWTKFGSMERAITKGSESDAARAMNDALIEHAAWKRSGRLDWVMKAKEVVRGEP